MPDHSGIESRENSSGRDSQSILGRRFSEQVRPYVGAAFVALIFCTLMPAGLWRPGTVFGTRENMQIGEAIAWWHGQLDIPERLHDTAVRDGRFYSYCPPMFTFIAAALLPFFGGVPQLFVVMLVMSVPILAFILFRRLTKSEFWGAVLVVAFVCGTSFYPVSDKVIRGAPPYETNHVLACLGLLIFLNEYFGRKRILLAAVGLGIAALSRQLTFLFAIPLCFMAWQSADQLPSQGRRVVGAGVACALMATIYCGLNTLKFGSPLHTGYSAIYEGRDDSFARDAQTHGLLSPAWLPRNLYYTNLGFPEIHRVEEDDRRVIYLRPNTIATGVWWTTPLLIWILFDFRRLIRDRCTVFLLAPAVGLFVVLMLWQTTGAHQRGYNRFSLDYLPVVLALLAPRCIIPKRRWVTLGMVAWSMIYFCVLLPLPHVRIWSA